MSYTLKMTVKARNRRFQLDEVHVLKKTMSVNGQVILFKLA